MSINTDETHRRAEALFKKEQQLHGGEATAEYQTELQAMREKTARLRALRLARDAANPRSAARPIKRKGPPGSAR